MKISCYEKKIERSSMFEEIVGSSEGLRQVLTASVKSGSH